MKGRSKRRTTITLTERSLRELVEDGETTAGSTRIEIMSHKQFSLEEDE